MAPDHLARARAGDEQAFRALTEPHRRELQVHCYRMLGSLTDSEDLVQETLLAAWRGLSRFDGRASVRSWLYRIATNRCLNARRDAGRRAPTEPIPPFDPPEPNRRSEITWLQPYPDTLLDEIADPTVEPETRYQAKEGIELAFIVALQRMPPRQAATLVLRDVLGFGADEVAGMLATTPTAIKGTLQRARSALEEHRTPAAPRAGTVEERDLSRRFGQAFTAADIEGLVALLTDEAWLSMPPASHEYHGRDAIAGFLRASFTYRDGRRVYLVPVRANTQPAFGSYIAEPADQAAAPGGLIVLTIAGGRIHAITRFHLDILYPKFGLPERLPVPQRPGGRPRRRDASGRDLVDAQPSQTVRRERALY